MTVLEAASPATVGLYSLPNELFIHILTPLPTRSLLPLTAVSHRFHNLILRVLHYRLLLAASLKDHKLILECYHPSSKFSEPYLGCEYLGSDGLSDSREGEGSFYDDVEITGRLGKLSGLYSHFRPFRMEVGEKPPRRHPAGDVPGHPGTSTAYASPDSSNSSTFQDSVCQTVTLESHELFSQLCGCVNIVKVGPRRGLFLSCVNVAEGVMRIWREWLAERAHSTLSPSLSDMAELALAKVHPASPSNGTGRDDGEERMLWIDSGRNVGMKVTVRERRWRRDQPIMFRRDEDVAVSYAIDFEELFVRTTHLLLAVEQSLIEQANHSGKAMIFGSFAGRGA
ncbi:MAG: hypothetical protein M1830_003875 [Pleopsidium flavum]|nr:MAG: hypothetical protein M1830_003875 [Pleopsidium flavum]